MVAYYEEKVKFSRESVVVCVPHEKYSEFLAALREYNNERIKFGFSLAELESLRSNVKRLTKGAISYQDFRGAYL
ncbi:MAG: hypothetical protein PHT07_24435 [Paludibacter sp.]|nr:hypothetical protein [Paludibacter sp.]